MRNNTSPCHLLPSHHHQTCCLKKRTTGRWKSCTQNLALSLLALFSRIAQKISPLKRNYILCHFCFLYGNAGQDFSKSACKFPVISCQNWKLVHIAPHYAPLPRT